MMQPFQSA